MLTVFRHSLATGLLSGLVYEMSPRDRSSRGDRVAANIGVHKAHGDIFCQRVDGAFSGGVGRAAERPFSVSRRDIYNDAVILGQEYFQGFPDVTHRAGEICRQHVIDPFVIRLVDRLLLANRRVVYQNTQIAVFHDDFVKNAPCVFFFEMSATMPIALPPLARIFFITSSSWSLCQAVSATAAPSSLKSSAID